VLEGTLRASTDLLGCECGRGCRAISAVNMRRELVERAIGGDRDAFSDLVRASLSRQYAIATLILRDGDRAQDAVQEALVSAWRGLSALRDPDAWEAWLHRLTVRVCFHQVRRDKRRKLAELQVKPEHDATGADDAPRALAERDRIERELDRLPIDQRASSSCITTWGCPWPRSPRSSTSPSGLHRPDSIEVSRRCAPPWASTPRPDWPRLRREPHEYRRPSRTPPDRGARCWHTTAPAGPT